MNPRSGGINRRRRRAGRGYDRMGLKASQWNVYIDRGSSDDHFVYNSKNGAVVKLNDGEFGTLRSNVDALDDALKADLERCEILVADDLDEVESVRQKYLGMKEKGSSFSLTIVPTDACNFSCEYCYEKNDNHHVLSPEHQRLLIEGMRKRCSSLKALNVTWFGGEPLLRPDIVFSLSARLIGLCAEHDIQIRQTLITNAYLLTDAVLEKIDELGFDDIQITIDGGKRVHDKRRHLKGGGGTFDTVFGNTVNAINAYKTHVTIRINIDEYLMSRPKHIVEFLDMLYARAIDHQKFGVNFGRCENVVNQCRACSPYVKYPSKYRYGRFAFRFLTTNQGRYPFIGTIKAINSGISPPCGAVTEGSIVVDADGSIKRCWNHVGYPEYSMGSVESMDDIRNPWLGYDPTTTESCRRCAFLPFCMGGCPDIYYRIVEKTGRGDCSTLKGFISDVVRYVDYVRHSGAPPYPDESVPANNR